MKKTLLIDLDGVLNEYKGDFDINYIPPMRNGVIDFIKKLSEGYNIKIFTTRNKLLTAKWLIQNNLDKYIQDITDRKEVAFLHIDDRCINFDGDYLKTINKIDNFKVWYK